MRVETSSFKLRRAVCTLCTANTPILIAPKLLLESSSSDASPVNRAPGRSAAIASAYPAAIAFTLGSSLRTVSARLGHTAAGFGFADEDFLRKYKPSPMPPLRFLLRQQSRGCKQDNTAGRSENQSLLSAEVEVQ